MFINRNSQILPGVDSQNTEMNTFKGKVSVLVEYSLKVKVCVAMNDWVQMYISP